MTSLHSRPVNERPPCGFCGSYEDVALLTNAYGERMRRCRNAVACAKRHLRRTNP